MRELITLKYKDLKRAATSFIASLSVILVTTAAWAAPSVEGIQSYQKNVHLSFEHKQRLADDITRYRNADNLWDVLRDEFSLPHYEDTPAVQEKIEWMMNNQDYLLRSANRAAPYLYYILQQVKKRHLPAELVLLPVIESGYNPFSLSNRGAEGIWQLMPGTASGLGVKQDWWFDGRRDVIASTRGALNYLAYLQSFFEGNWLLAIAAYNTGEGNVLAAIRKNVRQGRDTDFWSLPLAQQTRDYVPSLLALATIISHPNQYPIYFPPIRNAPYLGQVDVDSQISLKVAASLAGISYQKIIQLNPGFKRPSTSSKRLYKVILPIENVEQFAENLARSPLNHPIDWIHYKVKSGDTFASIAKKFDLSVNDIHKLNHLSKNTLRPGTHLLLPSGAERDDEEVAAPETKPQETAITTVASTAIGNHYVLQPGDTVYMVRAKDSIQSVAKRFHINSEALRVANHLSNNKLKPGKHLIIPTHLAVKQQKLKVEPGDTIYMVRRGDTIEKIANKFHTVPSAIRLANLVDNNSLSEGERLVIPTHTTL